MLTQRPHEEIGVASEARTRSEELPARSEEVNGREWLMEPINGHVAVAVGVAWLVFIQVVAALEPAPQRSEPVIGVLLGVAMLAIGVVMLVGLALRRRWGLVASLGASALAAAATIACPTSGHHQFGAWWYGELACVAALLAISVAALRFESSHSAG
jgi:peptidoglycan/LPS O-acetylase OafA/YrhL